MHHGMKELKVLSNKGPILSNSGKTTDYWLSRHSTKLGAKRVKTKLGHASPQIERRWFWNYEYSRGFFFNTCIF